MRALVITLIALIVTVPLANAEEEATLESWEEQLKEVLRLMMPENLCTPEGGTMLANAIIDLVEIETDLTWQLCTFLFGGKE